MTGPILAPAPAIAVPPPGALSALALAVPGDLVAAPEFTLALAKLTLQPSQPANTRPVVAGGGKPLPMTLPALPLADGPAEILPHEDADETPANHDGEAGSDRDPTQDPALAWLVVPPVTEPLPPTVATSPTPVEIEFQSPAAVPEHVVPTVDLGTPADVRIADPADAAPAQATDAPATVPPALAVTTPQTVKPDSLARAPDPAAKPATPNANPSAPLVTMPDPVPVAIAEPRDVLATDQVVTPGPLPTMPSAPPVPVPTVAALEALPPLKSRPVSVAPLSAIGVTRAVKDGAVAKHVSSDLPTTPQGGTTGPISPTSIQAQPFAAESDAPPTPAATPALAAGRSPGPTIAVSLRAEATPGSRADNAATPAGTGQTAPVVPAATTPATSTAERLPARAVAPTVPLPFLSRFRPGETLRAPESAASTFFAAALQAGGASPLATPAVEAATQAPIDLKQDVGIHRMIDRIEQLRDAADARDTRIRLLPDALGPVEVSVKRDGDAVRVHFVAEQPQTRQLIADAQPRLSELAEARGIRIAQTSVDGGGNGEGQSRQPLPQPSQTPASPRRADVEATDDATDARLA